MPNTYTELLRTTVGTASTSVTLNLAGISGYTDLVLVADATTVNANGSITLQFNGDTGNNYSYSFLFGNGSSAGSSRGSNAGIIGFIGFAAQVPVGTRAMGIAHIQNYSNTTTNKTVLVRNTPAVSATVEAGVGLWRNTAAITSITVLAISGASIAVGSTFSLYGIANADQGAAKATGGIITEDSQYWYHTFGASGTFTPKQSLTCDVLVVAGGGGGGRYRGGAGGGGGLVYSTGENLIVSNYSVTIGAGGAFAPGSGAGQQGSSGSNSVFSTYTATGGGGGGGFQNSAQKNGLNGGSGGGAGEFAGTGTVGTSTQNTYSGKGFGNSGGLADNGTGAGGGGGGAGAAASNASGSNGGNGGAGRSYSISGTSVGYAGGGGGGNAGGTNGSATDGGGSGSAGDGIVNRGGGGAGEPIGGSRPGSGSSGIVVIRYAK
jgi:hypothetical protein